MEARSNSSLRRGASCSRLGSVSFVNRQRQLLEGDSIEAGEVKKTKTRSESVHVKHRKNRDSPRNDDDAGIEGSAVVEGSPRSINRSIDISKRLKEIGESFAAKTGKEVTKEELERFEKWYAKNYIEPREEALRNSGEDSVRYGSSSRLKRGRSVSGSVRVKPEISDSQTDCDKDTDTSLCLSLQGLNDSDDDDNDDVDGEIEHRTDVVSPRKSSGYTSPRKTTAASTRSFEAKAALIRRRDSDTSVCKPLRPVAERATSADRTNTAKPSEQLDTSVSENGGDSRKTTLVRRTSSRRKLPIPNACRVLRKQNSETFLSISKDGGTEYVSLDLPNALLNTELDATNISEKNKAESSTNTPLSPTDMYPDSRLRQRPFDNKKRIVPPNHENGVSLGLQTGDKSSKPPLERKSLAGSIPASRASGIPQSPRRILASSPRSASVPNQPRSKTNSPRAGAQASPRGSSALGRGKDSGARSITPRSAAAGGSVDRRSNRDNVKTPDGANSIRMKSPRVATSDHSINTRHEAIAAERSTVKRRSSSGINISSPQTVSPAKTQSDCSAIASESEDASIEDEVVKQKLPWSEVSCQYLDLQQILALGLADQARSETEVQSEKTWHDAERVWLVHKGGFASASQVKGEEYGLPEGRVKIRLDHGGEILEVDEDDVEKANPPALDRAEDLSLLRYLNESSALHTLRQRYGGNLIHTYAGPSLVIVNPMQPLQIYSEKVIQMFKGCKQEDMPPHIFASAQIAYREMLNTRHDQSVVFMGRSGSGKTYNAQHILHYLAASAGTVNNVLTMEKLNSVSLLLEAFGNSRTILNTSASRFSQLTTLDFDHNGQIVSASVQVLMFEKTRVVRRPEGEPTFHVFYQLLAGVDSKLRSELQLNNLSDPNLFMTPLQKVEDKQRAMQYWAKIYSAMETMGVSQDEIKSVCSVLAAIYHLGVAGASKGNNNKGQFSRPAGAQRAASLLGISVEELGRLIFSSSGTATLTRNAARNSPADKHAEAHTTAMEALEGFVIGLYSDVFNAVVSMINRSLSSSLRSMSSITIVDTPGFQNPTSCGRQSGASFEDLCHNYMQEKLQLLFHDLVFTIPQDRYCQENVECDFEFVTTSPAAMVSLIEKPSQQSLVQERPLYRGIYQLHVNKKNVRTGTPEVREAEKKGLLWILDEEAIFPGATEDSFMDRFFSYHGEHKVKRDSLLRKASTLGNTFILNHFQGTNPVQYNASGWLKVCRENPITKVATQVLQDSKKSNIKELFNSVKAPVGGMVSGSIVGMEGSNTLRRVGSMRRTFMSGQAGLKKRSMCLQVKFQVDTIIEMLRKTKCHFIHCILPQANAGLCELRNPADMTPERPDDILMNVPLVRAQFRGNEILESVRIHRQGFPDFNLFGEFIQKFEGLVPPHAQPSADLSEKSALIQIVENLDIDKLNYRIGLSKIFFRAGALNRLESSRDDRVTGRITAFQAYCRGYTSRKLLAKLRVQHVAISCIQKNVRKFYQIRDWDWWKLYVKVKPLLNVHRTEEELHERELELETMKTKLEKLERERNDYKMTMDKLENRVVELTADLTEENTTATQASEMLESENAERMRLEKEVKDIQSRYSALKRTHDKMEMELTQTRLWQAETLEDHLDEDDVDGDIYKERYERVRKEMNFNKKKMQQQHEEELELEHNAKKTVEKRLHEALEHVEDLKRQLASSKKKSQKQMTEMQDQKLHLEEQMSRNNDLERKQRKFDTELSKIHDEIKAEKSMKEKVQREKDTIAADKYSLEKQIQSMKGDLESSDVKYERLQKELGETLTSAGHKDDHSLAALKRSKADLEAKLIDQEEELDDQAGTIQQLEQAKVRLEMTVEKSRQQHMKEIEEKEQEMEDLRYSTQKKCKQMESQIEEEYEERKLQMQKNRDLEQRIHDLQAHASHRDVDTERRLRKDLRKTRALLKDAEVVLQKQRTGEGSKAQIRQLRNQLEDLEYSSASAIKAKKGMELELADLQQQLDDLFKSKQEIENRSMGVLREKTDIQSQLEENEEDLADIMKKYKAVVQQQTVDQITLNDQLSQIEELVTEREKFKAEVNELRTRVQTFEENSADKTLVQRLENKVRDLESRLDLETTNKHRLEVQLTRVKEQQERCVEEKEHMAQAKTVAEENIKKVQRHLRDLREEFSDVQKRELEMAHKYKENENRVGELEADFEQNQSDLKLAFKRISDLQSALEEGLDSDDDISDSDLDDDDSAASDVDTSFLSNHKAGRRRSYDSSTRSRVTSSSSYLTDNPSSPRLSNNIDTTSDI